MRPVKKQLNVQINQDLHERIRSAAHWQGKRLPQVAEEAFRLYINDLQVRHGEPIPAVTGDLKKGRSKKV
jgi:hypothetical protein